ncbi:MAG: methionine adenosyltransferase [Firmicutes bacterium]|uniref:S-adenosylmethionine synthase n=1 Tax=Candidatus Onthovivens merdipullorum TaxID=2840889 RepID=A0A9D9GUU9_9BACL|nr:methionine adenosyltransferase [Candidatus Onthovivens merdipullorum]
MKNRILFTSESVSEGHPDKVCDQIADAILDAYLKEDENSFVACECFATENKLIIGGEITSKARNIDIDAIARNVIKDIGYDKDEYGFNYQNVEIINLVKQQSPDIRQGVVSEKIENQGAGDQGIMFGYASDETPGYMPLAISIAHKLVRYATELRKEGVLKHARPDMKSQVTIDYTDKTPKIYSILMSVQHDDNIDLDEFKRNIHDLVMIPVAKSFDMNLDFNYLINPTGKFVIGGPKGDTGLTGRKLIVDTYGGSARHGGGSFSGKDPSKVDRSAAYMARYIAKNLVASGIASRMEIQLSYAIGESNVQSINISTFKTSKYSDDVILDIINELFDLRPGMIIKKFNLKKPSFLYKNLANYGHFGRPDLDLPWEKLDKVDEIKEILSKIDKQNI